MEASFAASDRPYPDKVRLLRVKARNGLLADAPVPKEFLHDPRCTLQTSQARRLADSPAGLQSTGQRQCAMDPM